MGRTRIILGAVFIGGFIYLGLGAFTDTLTPYVSFSEAKASEGKNVQVTGILTEEKASWYSQDAERTFNFYLIEEESGDTLSVSYHGVKPSTFEEATSIVAIGAFDGERFHANQVLTKCPSKYEGQDPSEHETAYGREGGA